MIVSWNTEKSAVTVSPRKRHKQDRNNGSIKEGEIFAGYHPLTKNYRPLMTSG